MEIRIEDLWEELEFDESLKEYVERKVDIYIQKTTEQTDEAIKKRIEYAIENISSKLGIIMAFSECADTKINTHLLNHLKEMDLNTESTYNKQIPSDCEGMRAACLYIKDKVNRKESNNG